VREVGGNASAKVNILQMKVNSTRARCLDTTNDCPMENLTRELMQGTKMLLL